MLRISVVIPTYNSAGTLERCISAFKSSDLATSQYEVIVINDGSTDNTVEVLDKIQAEKSGINLTVIHQSNTGPAGARNAGINHAKGSIIAFTDSDCVVSSDWLSKVLSRVQEHEEDLIGGTTYCHDLLIFPWIVAPAGQNMITANLAYSAKAHPAIRFDEAFEGFWGEDTDFVLRLQEQGVKYRYLDELHVYHPANRLGIRKVVRRAFTRSSEVLLYKRYGSTVMGCFHPIFQPRILGMFSPAFLGILAAILVGTILSLAGKGDALIIASALVAILFIWRLYGVLVTNNPSNSHVSYTQRIKTLLYLFVYVPAFIAGRIKGSIKFKKVMV